MAAFDEYRDNFLTDYFYQYLPGYLLTEGTTLYNEMKVFWDLMNNTRETWITRMMSPLNIKNLLNSYYAWINADGDRRDNYLANIYSEDSQFEHYLLITSACSLYGITPIHEVGALSLAHMLRLLVFKTRSRLFDGSKRRLLEIYDTLQFSNDMRFRIQTDTGADVAGFPGSSARCFYRLYKPGDLGTATVYFNDTDDDLFNGGYYNIEILGIVYSYEILDNNALIYDNIELSYDEENEYDGM